MLISFRGPIGAGKSTLAQYLVDKGFTKVSFADPLKLEVFDFLTFGSQSVWSQYCKATGTSMEWNPPTPHDDFPSNEPIRVVPEATKIRWVNENKIELRSLLQWWGTEYRRSQNENYWLHKAKGRIEELQVRGKDVVMDDCRFDNEIDMVLSLGGYHIYIAIGETRRLEFVYARSGGKEKGISNHASEQMVTSADPRNSIVLLNDGTLLELAYQVDEFIEELRTPTNASA